MKLVFIDNFDSFTYNLLNLFRVVRPNVDYLVLRNNCSLKDIHAASPHALVIGPGPGSPGSAGISKLAIKHYFPHIPIFGVCLGMQCIGEVFGLSTVLAPIPVHGKTSMIRHDGENLFSLLANPLKVARYHSLCLSGSSPELKITAWCDDIPMGLEHHQFPCFGLQFHPESFMFSEGSVLVENFFYRVENITGDVSVSLN